MNQYCVYCASCVELDGRLYCDKREKNLTDNNAKRINHCADYTESPMGHVRTGKKYRPQRWRYLRILTGL